MTVTVKTFTPGYATSDDRQATSMTLFIDGADSLKAFRELVQRGANLWPDAPAEMKEAADLITNGMVMQPYSKMSGERK